MSRLGQKYELREEEVRKSRDEYQSEVYRASGLPSAPAVVVGDELAGQGPGISEEGLEAVIRRHLGLPALAPEH